MQLNLPEADLRLRGNGTTREIFDPLRHKWVHLTPEEWVRQHFTAYLAGAKGVPTSRMANEIAITLNGTTKRCDTVIYSPALEPVAIVEYKAPTVAITRGVFEQIARYNLVLGTRYLIISNGISHYCIGSGRLIDHIPDYREMTGE